MLFRLLFLAFALVLGFFGLRKLLKGGGALGELSGGERESLEALSQRSSAVKRALDVRAKVHDILHDGGASEGASALAAQIDEALRQLARQTVTLERVAHALEPAALEGMVQRETALNAQLDATVDAEARAALRQTLGRLEHQRGQLDQLRARRSQLDAAASQLVLDLENLHLALLDAASSRAGLGADAVKALRDKLQAATRDVATRTQAEEEIAKALEQVENQ